ncbi:MAG: DUF4173 domain-containing protein [Candidatus Kerfeldbacteria bacterium]|nr:DUF4173 domain-containing protein [Candidatus Kerfeldbacteria bacterium]
MTDQSIPTSQPLPLSPLAALLGVSVLFGILFDYFFYGKPLGIAFPLYVALGLIAFLVLAALFERRLRAWTAALLLAIAFFAVMVSVRASLQLTALNLGLTLYLAILTVREFIGHRLSDHTVTDYIWTVFDPLGYLHHSRTTVTTALEAAGVGKDSRITGQIVRGLGLAIPAIVIFVLLFVGADQIFRNYVENIFDIDILPRSMEVFVVTIVLISVFGKMFLSRASEKTEKPARTARLGMIEASILLWSVNIVFFLFLLVQFVYFFGGEQNISYEGLTYSEYARKGFFELLAVAVIAFLLLWKIEQEVVKRDQKHTVAFQAASTVMIVQVLFVMVSAFRRLMLYEEAYGFTLLRFYSHAFTVWLGVVFLILLIKVLVDHRENTFALRVFLSGIVFVAALNILNPDAFITQKNIDHWPTAKRPLDVEYITRLSDDMMPVVENLADGNEQEKNFARDIALERRNRKSNSLIEDMPWQSFHFARERARVITQDILRL